MTPSPTLPESAQKVAAYLATHGVHGAVVELPGSTRTAAEAAQAVACDVAQIAKSIIFQGASSGRPILVITSGANRVDEARVAALVGEKLAKATPDFVRAKTGYVIGGVPPIGHAEPPITLLDRDLLAFETIWAAAGTPRTLFPIAPALLVTLSGAQVADVRQVAPLTV